MMLALFHTELNYPEEEVITEHMNRSLRSDQGDRTRLAEELVTVQETVRGNRTRLDQTQRQLAEALERERTRMAELALHLDGAFPRYHGDPTKERSFTNLLSDYNMACDRFGFDEKMRALWLSNSLKYHAVKGFRTFKITFFLNNPNLPICITQKFSS